MWSGCGGNFMVSTLRFLVRSAARQSKRLGLRHVLVLGALLWCLPFLALAQDASIVGTVTDPTGSVVPNVQITITNVETGLTHTITTNETGQYVAPDLPIGHYTVKAEGSGFKAAEQKNVILNVGDRTRLDFQLQLGGAQDTITVEADRRRWHECRCRQHFCRWRLQRGIQRHAGKPQHLFARRW